MAQRASTMSGGEQQMLAIGRALMAEPRIILLDEPSAGLSPLFVQEIGAMMQALKREGEVALVLVEQNMRLAAQVVDRSEEHTSELQSLMRISSAVFCLTKKRRR